MPTDLAAVLDRLDRIDRRLDELTTSIEALAGAGVGIGAPAQPPAFAPSPEVLLDMGNRRVVRHDSGMLEIIEASGVSRTLVRNSVDYIMLGLAYEPVLVDHVRADGTATVYWPDGSTLTVERDIVRGAYVWIGSVKAYGSREQSDELKYGSRHPSAAQIDSGGANVLPPAP
jgi:hypothetical protein